MLCLKEHSSSELFKTQAIQLSFMHETCEDRIGAALGSTNPAIGDAAQDVFYLAGSKFCINCRDRREAT